LYAAWVLSKQFLCGAHGEEKSDLKFEISDFKDGENNKDEIQNPHPAESEGLRHPKRQLLKASPSKYGGSTHCSVIGLSVRHA